MHWLVFSYSLPSKTSSSPRVTLWRRLRRLGAIALKGSIHILPARDDCFESLQWLAQEVQQAEGEPLIMQVERFEGLSDQDIIKLFRNARQDEYEEIAIQAAELEGVAKAETSLEKRAYLLDALEKLRKQHADIARIDFFDCPKGVQVAAQLNQIAQAFFPRESITDKIAQKTVDAYQDKLWVTRPRPHVDRLACIWLIRRFIDSTAVIRYSYDVKPGEIAFDMKEGEFRHQGNLCTFEVMSRTFGLDNSAIQAIAEIVHEIDLRDEQFARPEALGVDALLRGWLLLGLSDSELESRGIQLFEGLYAALKQERV